MMIDKVSTINAVNPLQSSKQSRSVSDVKNDTDKISVSDEAKAKADEMFLNQVARETPDVRSELVEQIKLKIQDPNYLNEATIAATADRILSAYGF